jgi:hypothetical protein
VISYLFHYIYEPIKLIDSSIFGRNFPGSGAHLSQPRRVLSQLDQSGGQRGWVVWICGPSAAGFSDDTGSVRCGRGYGKYGPAKGEN